MSDTKLENALRVLLARGGWDLISEPQRRTTSQAIDNYFDKTPADSEPDPKSDTSCNIWEGQVSKTGEPYLLVDGVRLNAVRLAYAYANDADLLPGWIVRQTCENKLCVRGSHLERCSDGVSVLRKKQNEKRRAKEKREKNGK